MILTRDEILKEVTFLPALDEFQANPHSVDLRLAEQVILEQGGATIARTMETVTLPDNVMGVVYPRSSTTRRFIELSMTGVVDAGYSGTLMLPVWNRSISRVVLMKGERIASIVFHRLEKPADVRLSKYHGTNGTYVPDKEEETSLLETGRLAELKTKFPLRQAE